MQCKVLILNGLLFIIGIIIDSAVGKRWDGTHEKKRGNEMKPNILFIMADDFGWNDISWHNPGMPTKNLHHLAHHHGIILNNSYVALMCSPTRSAFLTGHYPYHVGTQHNVFHGGEPSGVPLKFKFLSEEFQSLGYETNMVGKWHVGYCNQSYIPSGRGFDHFFGYYLGAEDYYNHKMGYSCSLVNCEGSDWIGLDFWKDRTAMWDLDGEYSTDIYTRQAVEVVKRQRDQPMFLYLAYQAVHYPLQVPSKYLQGCDQERKDRRIYCGMVRAMDESIGTVIQALKDAGLYDDTIIVFSNDNGGKILDGGNNYPLRGEKNSLWEGGNRAVSFVHSSKFIPAQGMVYDGLFSIVDWYPTLLEPAGKSISKHGDGINQWNAIIQNRHPGPRHNTVINIFTDTRPHRNESGAAIRVGDWKLVTGYTGLINGWVPPNQTTTDKPIPLSEGFCSNGPSTSLGDLYANKRNREYGIPNFIVTDTKFLDDPTEEHNLINSHKNKATRMLQILAELKTTEYPSIHVPRVPQGNPKNFNGTYDTGFC